MVLEQDAYDDDVIKWLHTHVPLLDCPDEVIQRTYYFRWSTYKKHIKPTPEGYVITEFLPEVPWAGPYNTISCPAGHHFYEGRWLREQQYLDDYARFWFRDGSDPRRYSFWAADAIYSFYLITGNITIIQDLLPDLVRNYEGWEAERKDGSGLFWQYDDRDGMEFSVGGSGCRPTINSYMYGDAMAIAQIAGILGDTDLANTFTGKALELKRLVQQELWDDEAGFFKVKVNEAGLAYTQQLPEAWRSQLPPSLLQRDKRVDACELQGYVPWYFNLPDSGYERAWTRLNDPNQLAAPFGPTTLEQTHPLFMSEIPHECLWNGPSWPFATSQTLVALANLLRRYDQTYMNKQDYFRSLVTYAASHTRVKEDGTEVPWIDEDLNPYTGQWIAREKLYARDDKNKDRGVDYNHSTFCDLVISGLLGIVPRPNSILEIDPLLPEQEWDYFKLEQVPYQGNRITLQFDRTGEHYNEGQGFRVFVNNQLRSVTETLQKVMITLA